MSATIHQTFHQCLRQLLQQPLAQNTRLTFFNRSFALSSGDIVDSKGRKPGDAVGLVLCRYLLNLPAAPVPTVRKITFRELSDAGPLVTRFTENTNKIISSTFANNIELLETRALDLGGQPEPDNSGYDLYIRFEALPHLPVWLQFNSADDLFPAQSTLLFNQSAEHYLDMQCLFILATYLTGQLVAK